MQKALKNRQFKVKDRNKMKIEMVQIKDFRDPSEFDFKYYERLESEGKVNTPIRAVYRKEGRVAVAADIADAETGSLVQGNLSVLMRDIRTSPYIEEITQEKFYALCEQQIEHEKERSLQLEAMRKNSGIKDCRDSNEFDFKYYERLESEGKVNTPIRAVCRKGDDAPVATETFDPEKSSFVQGAFIKEIAKSPYVEEITQEEFYALCEQKMQKKTSIKPEIGLG